MDVKDKVVIITGASEGIGRAAARYLAHKGAKVVLAARSEANLNELEQELKDSLAIVCDMRRPDNIKNLVKKTIERYGRVDILINNAGQGMYGSVENIKLDDYKTIMDLNVYSVLEAMQAAIPYMRTQGGGMIINVSSGVTKRYIPHIGAYSSTKYALNALSFIARQELEKDKIIVSVISPKITATKFAENAIGSRPQWSSSTPLPIDSAEYVAEKIGELMQSEQAELVL